MINDGEQGNAVPPFCCSLMGIEKLKKKKKKAGFSSLQKVEVIQSTLLLFFSCLSLGQQALQDDFFGGRGAGLSYLCASADPSSHAARMINSNN